MQQIISMAEAQLFAHRWLPAWTGNNPEALASFYSDDALYVDPAVPEGVRGRTALLAYFRKLLARNPAWTWQQVEAIPLACGFLNKWQAIAPVGAHDVKLTGMCLVQLDDDDRIRRNEVYFDRSEFLRAISAARR
jgi:hypothetical protein